jgi:hypothetical protein
MDVPAVSEEVNQRMIESFRTSMWYHIMLAVGFILSAGLCALAFVWLLLAVAYSIQPYFDVAAAWSNSGATVSGCLWFALSAVVISELIRQLQSDRHQLNTLR